MRHSEAVDILLVEDDERDVELTLRALRKSNLANSVHVARDGVEALDFLFGSESGGDGASEQKPRLVLLDLKLPKLDGLEVLRRIKSDDDTKVIPVVVLTSSSEERDIVESYRLGVNSYMVKPVAFDKFLTAVSEIGLYWLLLNEPPC